jgi:hypothetical protein
MEILLQLGGAVREAQFLGELSRPTIWEVSIALMMRALIHSTDSCSAATHVLTTESENNLWVKKGSWRAESMCVALWPDINPKCLPPHS